MNDAERAEHLENLLATFLKPIKGIPFPVVIKALCGNAVENVDLSNPDDRALIDALQRTAVLAAQSVAQPHPRRRDLRPRCANVCIWLRRVSRKTPRGI